MQGHRLTRVAARSAMGDVEDLTHIGFDAKTSGQRVACWPAGQQYVRPAVTPTSLGPPRPVRRLLA